MKIQMPRLHDRFGLRQTPRRLSLVAVLTLVASAAGGCGDVNAALDQLAEARRLASDLHVEFTKASDAANRAVMADTDTASVSFAEEASQAKHAVQADIDALSGVLRRLNYPDEAKLLQQFVDRFTEYRALDDRILDLAVQNTNLKAQRLSFGPAQEAADSFRDALAGVAPLSPGRDAARVDALTIRAVATVREIQVLQAPHIANADDTVMTRMETQMATSEDGARKALQALAPLVSPSSRPKLAEASAALDRFMSLNAEIIALSRRNTNVRTLALSLDQKRRLVAPCEESLRALQGALAKRGYPAGR